MSAVIAPTLDTYRAVAVAPRVSLQARVTLASCTHHGPDRDPNAITLIVMHCTEGDSAQSSITYLNTTTDKVASYAYVIDRDGTIYRMCPAHTVAYHAGDSQWPNPRQYPPGNVYEDEDGDTHHHTVNPRSLGIAWANKDDGSEPLTRAQVESALWLCGVYLPTTAVQTSANVIGHRECSPGRKFDPTPCVMPMDVWRALVTLYVRGEA